MLLLGLQIACAPTNSIGEKDKSNNTSNPDSFQFETELAKGLELSKKTNKPILLIFTSKTLGYDEFQNDLLLSNVVFNTLQNKFVNIILFVDARDRITSEQVSNFNQYMMTKEGKNELLIAKNWGKVHLAFEHDRFMVKIQPLYVVIDDNLNVLIEPFGYTKRNVGLFIKKLNEGIMKYEMKKK
jgi:hypothetical protein